MREKLSLKALGEKIHLANHKWWHDEAGNRIERNRGELRMLMISEIAECMEGERKDLMDTHLPHRKMAEVELADFLIRFFDYLTGFQVPFEEWLEGTSFNSCAAWPKIGESVIENKGEALELIVAHVSLQDWSDALYSTIHYARSFDYDLDGAIVEKLEYNRTRADHTYEARASENGKKF